VRPLGLLGGTFDPVHYGHLRPAQDVLQALSLDAIHVIPAAQPPHRQPPVVSAEHRLRMVELALREFAGFHVDDREYRRGGPSYTVFTLESLRAELGARPLCLLMGTDTFRELETWHQWTRLPELAHLVVMQRPGWPLPATLPAWAAPRVCRAPRALATAEAGCVYFQTVTPLDISATRVRAALARGEPATDWLPPAVSDYILTHGLYSARKH